MILAFLAAAIAASSGSCPDVLTDQALTCRALAAQQSGAPAEAAADFEQAAQLNGSDAASSARALAAAGNMWLLAGEAGKAAVDLDKALEGNALAPLQRGEALLDRARAAADQNDLKAARAKVNEAAGSISEDPFLWYFSASLAMREGDASTAKTSIDKALALAPNDSAMLFEAGHVAEFAGDDAGARDYWTRAVAADPNGEAGKAARHALDIIGPALTVKMEPAPPK